MRKSTIIVVFSLLIASHSFADENSWSTTGPPGGSVFSIEIHPQNPQIIYIGTIQNGIFKSTDGGGFWNQIDGGSELRCMRRIAVHPFGPDTVYATSVNGLFKSVDGGDHWARIFLPQGTYREYRALFIHPEDPDLIIAGGQSDEWMSTDGGQNWQQLNFPVYSPGIADVAVDPQNPDIIYIAANSTISGNGIFKSLDRGQTWIDIQNNIQGDLFSHSITVDPYDSDIVYFGSMKWAGFDSCLFKSTNGGQTWNDITPPEISNADILKVVVSPYEDNTVYACSSNDGVIKSTDGGISWVKTNEGLRILEVPTMEIDSENGIIYIGTYLDGIYKSENFGSDWQRISENINSALCQSLTVSPFDPSYAIASISSGLYRTIDAGSSWEYMDIGSPASQIISAVLFDRFDSMTIYACTIQRSNNPSFEAGFYRSTDNGHSWQFFSSGLPYTVIYKDIAVSYFGSDNRRIFLSSYRGVYYSDDSGENWNLCFNGIPNNSYFLAVEVSPANQNVVAAGDLNCRLYLSTDRGDSWQILYQYPGTNGWFINDIEFHPYDAYRFYVITGGEGLFETTDGGQSWENLNNNLPRDPEHPSLFGIIVNPNNPTNLFVSSSRYGIYQSHDSGQNWEAFNAGLDTTATAGIIEFAAGDTNQLYFASTARSVWTITRTLTDAEDKTVEIKAGFELELYPNPFNSSATIEFSLGKPQFIKLAIYDILGREIHTLIDEKRPAGINRVSFDASCLSSGVYFYRLQAGNAIETRRMILLK